MSSTVSLIAFPNIVLTGTTVPATSLGINGQLYVRNTTGIYDIYGPKTSSGWGSPVSLIGPAGAPGAPGPQGPQGPAGAQGPPGGLTSRQTTTVTTSSINAGATWTGTVTLSSAFILLKLGLDFPGWLRVYPTQTDRTNDATRLQNEDPTATVTAEIATSGNQELAPYRSGVIGSNLETPFTNTQFISLRNLDSVARTFTITFRWVALEA